MNTPLMNKAMDWMPSCRELDAFVVDYLEGRLPWRQRLVFRMHLGLCPKCRAYLKAYAKTIALSHEAYRDGHEPPEMPQELIAAILAAREGGAG
ncbi:MAG: zf-HC2 domain-containing protein [Alphaproteobacteria bacterium]